MTVSHTVRWLSGMLVGVAFVCCANNARGGMLYDEAIHGDLSGDRFSPSVLEFGLNENILRGSVGPAAEDDVFTFTLPPETYLASVVLLEYSSPANTSFLGVQHSDVYGSSFNHWGYVSFGQDHLGNDLLSSMAESRGLFEAPLGPGTYTWWIDEYTQLETYALRFDIVPEPSTAFMLLSALGLLLGPALRRRS